MKGSDNARPVLSRSGRRLVFIGAAALLIGCAYDFSIRFQDFDAWMSGVRTMSRLKDESFFGNLMLIFRDDKMRSLGFTMLYLVLGILLGIFGLLPGRGAAKAWSAALAAAALTVFGFFQGIIVFSDPFGILRALPTVVMLAGCILLLLSRLKRRKPPKGPGPGERLDKLRGPSGDRELKVMVSACLIGRDCKYSGGNNLNEDVMAFLEGKLVIPVCPEVMGGLPVPRMPCEISGGRVIAKDGRSMDEPFMKGALKCISIARHERPDMVILKENSPSCGVRSVYDGTFSGRVVPGRGIFADMVVKEGIPVLTEKDFAGYGRSIGDTDDKGH